MATKVCTKCRIEKEHSCFSKDRKQKDGHCCWCKECQKPSNKCDRKKETNKIWADNHKDKMFLAGRKHKLKKYGKSIEWYNEQFQEQDGRCAICRKHVSELDVASLSVDHDHETGKVRDLLCNPCNLIIGNCFEEKGILISAILYLEKHSPNE